MSIARFFFNLFMDLAIRAIRVTIGVGMLLIGCVGVVVSLANWNTERAWFDQGVGLYISGAVLVIGFLIILWHQARMARRYRE